MAASGELRSRHRLAALRPAVPGGGCAQASCLAASFSSPRQATCPCRPHFSLVKLILVIHFSGGGWPGWSQQVPTYPHVQPTRRRPPGLITGTASPGHHSPWLPHPRSQDTPALSLGHPEKQPVQSRDTTADVASGFALAGTSFHLPPPVLCSSLLSNIARKYELAGNQLSQ